MVDSTGASLSAADSLLRVVLHPAFLLVLGGVVTWAVNYLFLQRGARLRREAREDSESYSALVAPLKVSLLPFADVHRPKVRKFYKAGLACMSDQNWHYAQGHLATAHRHAVGTQRAALQILLGVCAYKRDVHVQAYQHFMAALSDAQSCPDAGCIVAAQHNLDVTVRELRKLKEGKKLGDIEFLYRQS